jgi:tRNA G18 (ribose-2'-O)-methylase SpoU
MCGSPAKQAARYDSLAIEVDVKLPLARRVIGVLDNIRSAYNVGSIFRTADGAGIQELFLCGITPSPENVRVRKTALGAEEAVPWRSRRNGVQLVRELMEQEYFLVVLEGGEGARSLYDCGQDLGELAGNKSVALVVGNEKSGVDPGILACCDLCLKLPMQGAKRSLNVVVAFGIAAYALCFEHSAIYPAQS